ncbi:enoyl-CoA hydratase/isomerase family protein [Wenzhouxiangella sp. AB-CW3]|uniref:enoyl-CoA hydratase-related protein n=1 Tax=Wenzhouxiangella sp. AB-CW3 TaxID=2771012 RepID=UPI00168C0D47|nr:enoyl-CoA hydratase-related protein [Wenzhouxiangella sp. AB-CW3]QOC21736.1 enoyl-CoA hydratase/isomerase family protein [Wenzhouxiangella sp. AB-CW3]
MTELLTLTTNDRGVATLTLNRPEVHNAFNAELIVQLSDTFDQVAEQARVLVLTGKGHSFSAGADLNWMRAMAEATEDENRRDAENLAAMLRKLDQLPCPTIARVNGHAFGGGVGLIACCDMAVAIETARFGLTEVRLGLAPATIAPFVVPKIGVKHARRFMLTGERMDVDTAIRIGLVTAAVPAAHLDGHVHDLIDLLLAGGPKAQGRVKELIRTIATHASDPAELDRQTSQMIASLRVSSEGQEGLNAFLEKRKPSWTEG